MKHSMRIAPVICLALVVATLGLSGCTSSYTKPRSEVLSEAKSKGIAMTSSEQEKKLFFGEERLHQDRLVALLSTRSGNGMRDSSYHIGPGDEVELNVFDVPELNVTEKVKESGFISLPLIGAIKASGMTESELQQELRSKLAKFVKNPQVSVFISGYGSQSVAVMGAVFKPGTYPLQKGSNSLFELISLAGGVNDKAGGIVTFIPAEITGVSARSDAESRARLSLATYQAGKFKSSGIEIPLDRVFGTSGGIPIEVPVRGGDMIIVSEAGKVNVDGEVARRGTFDLGRRMTLLGALASAGGITYSAKVDEVEIVRPISGEKKAHLVMDLEKIARGEQEDVRLRDGDIVLVPSESGRKLRQDTFDGLKSIINFGVGGTFNVAP